MKNQQEFYDVAKETSYLLTYFEPDFVSKIPDSFLNELKELSKQSNKLFYIDGNKSLTEQNISDGAKDLISLIYYNFVATEDKQKELAKTWNENELSYQEKHKQKYGPNKLFNIN